MRVLVADDERVTRTLVVQLLSRWGYEPVETVDGVEALGVLNGEDPPRLCVLDWMMPGMDGPRVCREFRSREDAPFVHIILLTAKSKRTHVVAGLDAGADDFLSKPFDPDELRVRLEVGRRVVELQTALTSRVAELQDALAHVRTLTGLLPICANCHKVRDDRGYWNRVESYMSDHLDVEFSHGICPGCMHELYPEVAAELEGEQE